MVLYIEALRENLLNYVAVAGQLKELAEKVGEQVRGYEESMENTRANLRVLDELRARGIVELKVS